MGVEREKSLSIVAEFARKLHEQRKQVSRREYNPCTYPSKREKLLDVKVVIFDVYGTLFDYWRDDWYSSEESKMEHLLDSFRKTADFFGMSDTLAKMNPKDSPEQTLRDFYHGLIALNHEKALKKGRSFPEVRIEEIWLMIIMMLARHGYTTESLQLGEQRDVARCMAYFYNFHSLGRGMYPGVVPALQALKENNLQLGILSNAQFYTPIDLTLYIRDQSGQRLDDSNELFDENLVVFSYESGVAKPNSILFRKLFDTLYELHVLPSQTVLVGNDLIQDIQPAQQAGMLTALWAGDDKTAFMHDQQGTIIPDIVFTDWTHLSSKVSFYESR